MYIGLIVHKVQKMALETRLGRHCPRALPLGHTVDTGPEGNRARP